MKKYFVFFFLILLSKPLLCGDYSPYINSDIFLYSEPVTIKSAFNDWKDEGYKQGGDYQYAAYWLESGVNYKNFTLGILNRYEYRTEFTPETADFYDGSQHERNLELGKKYNINLEAERFRLKGIRGSYKIKPNNRSSLTIGGTLFHANRLLKGQLTGNAQTSTTNSKDYDYNADVDYVYDKDVLFDRENVQAPKGKGYAIDLFAQYKLGQFTVSTKIRDLFGKISWHDVPYTTATATSDTKTFDDDGFVEINPLVSGKDGYYNKFTQKLKPYGDINLSYTFNQNKKKLLFKTKYLPNAHIILGIGGVMKHRNITAGLTYWKESNMVELSAQRKNIGFSIGMDKPNLSKARGIYLSFFYK